MGCCTWANPISTGRVEGFSSRIKAAKIVGYGYCNADYFFSLIRYFPIPSMCRIIFLNEFATASCEENSETVAYYSQNITQKLS